MASGPRDRRLLDTLEQLETRPFNGTVWRVTREGRDPTQFFAGGNRWDDGTFEVLYTSLEKEGALAEMRFHLSRGQPVVPSKIHYRLHELAVRTDGVFDLTDPELLTRLGIDMSNFGRLPYLDRQGEYEACQKVGEAVHFLGSKDPIDPSAVLVPNARHPSQNLVLFGDYVNANGIVSVTDHGLVNWNTEEDR